MTSRRDARSEVRFGGDHVGRAWGAMRGTSARGRGGRCLPGGCASSERTTGLDVARRPFETGGAFVERAIDVDVAEFPALEAGLVISRVVTG